jgi:hypothetical protein
VTWQPLPDDIPLDHEAVAPTAGFSALPADAPLDAPADAGFTDEQQQQIIGYLPKATDAADLEKFSLELSGGKARIGNAQQILDAMKKGATPDAFRFTPPTVDKSMATPQPHDRLRDAVGEGIFNGLDAVMPGLGSLLRQNQGAGKAYTEHAANALAFDYGPQVGGFIDTVLHPGSELDNNIAHERAILSGDSEGHGVASALGELTGVGATALLGNEAGLANLPRLARGAVTAGEGALYGSGAAGPDNRAEGAAVGAVAAPVIGALARVPGAIYNAGKTVLGASPDLARRIVAKAIKADQNAPADVAKAITAANSNDVPMMIADTGENVRGLLSASARTSGPARTVARDALEERQGQLADRVTGAIERDLGPVANPHEVADALLTSARDKAAPLYEAAYARSGADAFGKKVAPLLQRPSMKKALGNAYRIAQEEGRDPTTLGFTLDAEGNVALDRVPSWQTLDYVKRGMDDVVEGYKDKVTGRYNFDTEGRAVNNTLRSYLKAFDAANPGYAAARAAYAGPVSGINAMNTGRKALSMTADDLEARMRDMTPFEKQMFALGTRRAMAELVSSKGDSADVVHALVGTGKKRAMLARLFGDRKSFQQFVDTLGQEREGFRTFKKALTGSPTAANLQDDAAVELATATLETVLSGGVPWRSALRQALKFGIGKAGDKAKQEVAALLSNTDPARFRELAAELRAEAHRRGLIERKIGVAARGVGNAAVAIGQQPQ